MIEGAQKLPLGGQRRETDCFRDSVPLSSQTRLPGYAQLVTASRGPRRSGRGGGRRVALSGMPIRRGRDSAAQFARAARELYGRPDVFRVTRLISDSGSAWPTEPIDYPWEADAVVPLALREPMFAHRCTFQTTAQGRPQCGV
ncbi:hypothetical protein MTO96_011820 [Rhipicephalus appendiculatus]